MTHEQYIATVRDVAVKKSKITSKEKELLNKIKLVYGHACHESWQDTDEKTCVVQVCLNAEESLLQLAGTTLHELGHVIAGHEAAHGLEWKAACRKLGLPGARAVGTNYDDADMFSFDMLVAIKAIPEPTDGSPVKTFEIRGLCGQGIGTRGGKSRGAGSGSRMKKLECPKCGYAARTTKKWIEVGLPTCPCGMKMIDL